MTTPLATLEDLKALFETPPTGARLERLDGLLAVASDEVRSETEHDYLRTPALADPPAADESWTVHADGGDLIHLHDGVVSLSSIEYSTDFGESFVVPALTAGTWSLEYDGLTNATPPAGEPYFHLRLNPWSTIGAWPRGRSVVRLTGVRGWPAVPAAVVEAVCERARQIAYADPSYQGIIASEDSPILPMGRWPDSFYRFLERERKRFLACYL